MKKLMKQVLLASLIDESIIGIAVLPLVLLILFLNSSGNYEFKRSENILWFLPIFFLVMLLSVIKDGNNGQSIGKKIMGLQVIDRKTGSYATSKQSIKRNIYNKWDYLNMLLRYYKNQLPLGDRVAGTELINVQKSSSSDDKVPNINFVIAKEGVIQLLPFFLLAVCIFLIPFLLR